MTAAIYARKSTDQSGVADAEKSASHRFDRRLDASRPSRELAIQWGEEMRKALDQ